MGWFEEQITQRAKADDNEVTESCSAIAEAISGNRLAMSLNDDRSVAKDAIGEILEYHHVKAGDMPDDVDDMNEVLEYVMRPHGIMHRNVRLDKGWYKDATGAMLGRRLDDKSVIALIPMAFGGYKFFDRNLGKYVRITAKNRKLIDDEGIVFYKPFPLSKMSIADFIKYLYEQVSISDFIVLCIALLVTSLVGLLAPHINKILLGDVVQSGNIAALFGAGIYMLCASIGFLMFGVVRALANSRISVKLSVNVEAASMMRLLSMPADFFRDYSAGELSNRMGYINMLAEEIVDMVLSTTLGSLFSLIYIFQIFHYAPGLVAPALTVTALTLLVTIFTVISQMRITRETMLLGSKESGISYALISGIQKIRLAGAEKRAFGRWGRAYAKQAKLVYNPPILLKVSQVIVTAISLIGTMVMYYFAVKTKVSISDYYAFNTSYGMVSAAFVALAQIVSTLAQIKPTIDMAKPLFDTEPEVSTDKQMVTRLKGGVEINNVTFRYSDDMPAVLDDLSLKIEPGQYVAIVGKTGCGKSTLMRILLGFETPQKGAVYYDGKDLKKLDLKSLRQKIGAVMQNGKLFLGDIYSNIVISAPWLSLNEAWEAARIAGIDEDIRSMPMGMNTLISEGQGGISGGQRQRLMIARAVAPKPKILIFDEATSALDNLTQKHVSDALDEMKCTRIVIAHRLSTIKHCDRIIVLEGGKIIEDGTYDELIAKKGFFAMLVERQRLDDSEE
ncbi:MAG: NHLP bacteriocin export ABC transporter permease/ATPase subunit [Lachnospiraceae bacterium]|nr:NHLP bacteriocin export ABC transporter permease/ATPase subunit [Lachnospiraceae bacterium]